MLSLVMCLMLMGISAFAQDGTGWTSTYTDVVINESNPRCVLTVMYNWRKNELGQIEIFIYHKYLSSDTESDCIDFYRNHENMYNDIIVAKIIFKDKTVGEAKITDCAYKEFQESYIVYTSSCQTEEKTTSGNFGHIEYHFKACSESGNCKAKFEYCFRYVKSVDGFVPYCRKTIIEGATADCPEVIKNEETGTAWQCHPKDCFPFPDAYNDFNPIPTSEDVVKYDDAHFYNRLSIND